MRSPTGFTLIEVVVSLAVFTLILGVCAMGLASLRQPSQSAAFRQMTLARDSAVRTGTVVVGESLVFLPDGRAIGLNVEPLTGAPRAAR